MSLSQVSIWRIALTALGASTKLLYTHWTWLVLECMGDRLRAGKPPRYVSRHAGQLSLLPPVGLEMSTAKVR